MEARSWFRMLAAPEGEKLGALLEFAAARRARYPTFLLVERASSGPVPAAQAALASELLACLNDRCVTVATTDRWPGGEAQQQAQVRYYKLDQGAARALARVGSLSAFAPPLPEDLCILGSDKRPWLVSSSRRGRFYLQLDPDEQRELGKALPWLQLTPEPEPPHE